MDNVMIGLKIADCLTSLDSHHPFRLSSTLHIPNTFSFTFCATLPTSLTFPSLQLSLV